MRLFVVEGLVDGGEAVVVFGVDGVVPLVEPGEEVRQLGEERGEFGVGPSPRIPGLVGSGRRGRAPVGLRPSRPKR